MKGDFLRDPKAERFLLGVLLGLGVMALGGDGVWAQSTIVPDGTLGAERSRVTPLDVPFGLPIDAITGGAQRGQNLFHSFQEFNVAGGRSVYFFIPNPLVRHVLSRVTGTNRSDILGTLGTLRPSDGVTQVPGVNVFLINPNGVLFGKNASLDIGGSFLVTTANAVQLETTGLFSASQPTSSHLLTVNPSAFLFNAIAQQAVIVNQGQLQVAQGQNLILLGGNIRLDQGSIQSLGGRVELGGLMTIGTVGLNQNDSLSLNFTDHPSNAEISLNKTAIALSGTPSETSLKPGAIQIQGGLVTLQQGSQINSITQDASTGGDIIIKATQLKLDDISTIGSITIGPGTGGALTINVDQLNLKGASSLITTTILGQGEAGKLTLRATDLVELSNNSGISSFSIGTSKLGSQGSGGDVTVITKNLKLEGAGIVTSSFLGQGTGGNLKIQVSESIDLIRSVLSTSSLGTGIGGALFITTQNFNIQDGSQVTTNALNASTYLGEDSALPTLSNPIFRMIINDLIKAIDPSLLGNVGSGNLTIVATDTIQLKGKISSLSVLGTQTSGSGRAGNLTIQTRRLLVNPGGWISTDAREYSQGKGGNLTINASESIEVRGSFTEGIALISSITQGSGDAGNITITAKSLILDSAGKIASESRAQGNAGDIKINLQETLNANYSSISTASVKSSGGAIGITAQDIRLLNDSDIKTAVLKGSGKGGGITLTARSIVALNDSDILAFARDGKGGNITLNTRAFFGQNYRPAHPGTNPATLDKNDRVDINASGSLSSGTITTPDTSFIQNSLNQLPKDAIDITKLLANTCIIRKDKPEGTFYITGTGGFPTRPGDPSLSNYPTQTITQTATRPWQKGDPIAEPQGFYKLANGRLVMSRECPSEPSEPIVQL